MTVLEQLLDDLRELSVLVERFRPGLLKVLKL
jgi:hypothetical protein